MNKDMTKGNSLNVLLGFSLPLLLSMVFQQLYNIMDSVIAGKFIGEQGLAAVGASTAIVALYLAVAVGGGMGISVVISQLFGCKEFSRLKSAVSTAILSMGVTAVVLSTVGLIICRPLMRILQTPQDIFEEAALYLNIYIAGILFLLLYNCATSIFTALGDSKTPLYFLIFSSILNIVLDYLFVRYIHRGVASVAWATFIAQGLAAALANITLYFRLKQIPSEESYKRFDAELLKRILTIAVPSILQQSFISVGQLFVQGLINSFGSVVVAGYSAAFRINTFVISCFTTFGNAVSSFTAQNYGAGKYKRIKEGYYAGIRIVLFLGAIAFSSIFFGSDLLISLFIDTDDSPEVIRIGSSFLHTVSPFYMIISLKLVADGGLRGMGFMKEFMIATFSDLLIRVLFSFLLVVPFGYSGIWWSYPIGWVIGTLLSLYYRRKVERIS